MNLREWKQNQKVRFGQSLVKQILVGFSLLSVLTISSSCGPMPTPDEVDVIQGKALPGVPEQDSNILFGTYEGTLSDAYDGTTVQNFSLQFGSKEVNGATVPYVKFTSNGQTLGEANFETAMQTLYSGYNGSYAFLSPSFTEPAISSRPVQLELILTVSQGQFYPAYSGIRFLECGFAQDYCSYELLDGTLNKR